MYEFMNSKNTSYVTFAEGIQKVRNDDDDDDDDDDSDESGEGSGDDDDGKSYLYYHKV